MGFLVAILNALTVSSQDVLIKKLRGESNFFLIWLRMAAAVPVLALLVTIFAFWEIPPLAFWFLILGVSLPIEAVQFYLGYTALQRSPLSLIAPLGASVSIFLIPAGWFILGELPTGIGLLGVLFIVFGTFFLGFEDGTRNPWQALKNIFKESGSWLVIIASAIVSVSITTQKLAFKFASPLLTAFYLILALAIFLLPFAFFLRPRDVKIEGRPKFLTSLGLVSGLSMALNNIGLSLLPAVYYISVKRLSILFNIFFGRFFFQENNIQKRFLGALIMLAGVILIALG